MNQTSLSLDNYKIELSLEKSTLSLKADNTTTEKHYSLQIENSNVSALTSNLYSNTEELYSGLVEAIEGPFPEIQATIDQDGKLTYCYTAKMGSREKKTTFTIQLEADSPKSSSPQPNLEKEVAELSGKLLNHMIKKDINDEEVKKQLTQISIKEQEDAKEISDLKGQVTLLQDRLDTMEKLVNKSRSSGHSSLDGDAVNDETSSPRFAPLDYKCQHFTYSNHNKTVTCIDGGNSFNLFSDQPLSKQRKFSFALRVDDFVEPKPKLFVGIVTGTDVGKILSYKQHCSFTSLYSNVACLDGQRTTNNNIEVKKGDLLSVHVDLSHRYITFKVGPFTLFEGEITVDDKAEYYACLLFNRCEGTTVTPFIVEVGTMCIPMSINSLFNLSSLYVNYITLYVIFQPVL